MACDCKSSLLPHVFLSGLSYCTTAFPVVPGCVSPGVSTGGGGGRAVVASTKVACMGCHWRHLLAAAAQVAAVVLAAAAVAKDTQSERQLGQALPGWSKCSFCWTPKRLGSLFFRRGLVSRWGSVRVDKGPFGSKPFGDSLTFSKEHFSPNFGCRMAAAGIEPALGVVPSSSSSLGSKLVVSALSTLAAALAEASAVLQVHICQAQE